MSGSANVAYLSTSGAAGNGQEELLVGQTVAFGLSTTTAGGIGIAGSMTISQDYDANGGANATGGQAVLSQLVEQQSLLVM